MAEAAPERVATAFSELASQLRVFRQSHTYAKRILGSVACEYIACGRGNDALLLLPGGMSTGESLYRHIAELEGEFRILAPSYPALGTMSERSRKRNPAECARRPSEDPG